MTLDEIRELIQVVVESGVAELEVQRGENRVRIRRSRGGVVHDVVLPPGAEVARQAQPVHAAHTAAAASASAHAVHSAAPEGPDVQHDPSLVLVKSPIVGTFYECPSPGSSPFVRPGDNIEPGKVLCIIESMKLMNEIEAEIAGVVVSKLVENGSPVEYGEALFAIRPH